MNGFYKLVIEQLQKNVFQLLRQGSTSHQVWSDGLVSVTVSTNCYSRHTANAIMKQAKLDYRFK